MFPAEVYFSSKDDWPYKETAQQMLASVSFRIFIRLAIYNDSTNAPTGGYDYFVKLYIARIDLKPIKGF